MRNGRLQRVEAVVQRQQGVPAEGDDDSLVLQAQHAGARLLRPHASVRAGRARAPLLHRGRADPVSSGGGSHALLTSLDCPTDRLGRRGAAVENLSHNASLHAAALVPPHRGTEYLIVHKRRIPLESRLSALWQLGL